MSDVIDVDVMVTKPVMGAEWGLYAICTMQVCAYGETPPDQVEARANELNPPGSSAPWRIIWGTDPEDDMNNPSKAPVPCSEFPERIHYLLSC